MTGRFTRKSYSIWDNVKNEKFYELHYRYEVDDMCDILNDYEEKVKSLEKENKQLKQAYNDAKKDVEKKEQILKDIMKDNLLIQDIEKELEE